MASRVEYWIAVAEKLIQENNGVLPTCGWLQKNGCWGLYNAIKRYPEKFLHIKRMGRTIKCESEGCETIFTRYIRSDRRLCDLCNQERYKKQSREHAAKLRKTPEGRAHMSALVRKSADKARLDALIHYCGGKPHCQCPGCRTVFIGFLQFDHIDGLGSKHLGKNGKRISSSALRHYLRKNNYPEGYQILCNNCNGPGGKGTKKKCPMHGKPH
jgi:hypothetical protein